MSITWIHLQETSVTLSWKLLAGDFFGARLGHQISYEPESNIQINEWNILRDDIDSQETLVEIYNEFDIRTHNSFVLFPYEDGVMQNNNEYSGKPATFTVKAPPSGKEVVDYYFPFMWYTPYMYSNSFVYAII